MAIPKWLRIPKSQGNDAAVLTLVRSALAYSDALPERFAPNQGEEQARVRDLAVRYLLDVLPAAYLFALDLDELELNGP